jgi:hypothetical protein
MTSRTAHVKASILSRAEPRATARHPAGTSAARPSAKALVPAAASERLAVAAKGLAPAAPQASRTNRAPRGRGASSPRSDQERIAELKVKLRDDDYMNGAILRIATVLSARLTLR